MLHEIKSEHKSRRTKVIGRGGKRGKTSGRGGKGQTARAGHRIRPEIRDVIKKLPKLRGYSSPRIKKYPHVLKLKYLEDNFESGAKIDSSALKKIGKIKIIGEGKLTKKFFLEGLSVSKSVKQQIEKTGGNVTNK